VATALAVPTIERVSPSRSLSCEARVKVGIESDFVRTGRVSVPSRTRSPESAGTGSRTGGYFSQPHGNSLSDLDWRGRLWCRTAKEVIGRRRGPGVHVDKVRRRLVWGRVS
jgi:hypothetical protein